MGRMSFVLVAVCTFCLSLYADTGKRPEPIDPDGPGMTMLPSVHAVQPATTGMLLHNDRPSTAADAPVTGNAGSQPADTTKKEEFLAALIAEYEALHRATPSNEDVRFSLTALYLLSQQPAKAFQLIPKEDLKNLKARSNLLLAWAWMESGDWEKGLVVLEDFARKVRSLTDLKIKKALWADGVHAFNNKQYFGNYKAADGPFKAGQYLALYTEVENFTIRKDGDKFSASVKIELDVIDSDGNPVAWDNPFPAGVDYEVVSYSQFSDFCPTALLYMPQKLKPGDYQMKVIITDNMNRDKAPVETFLSFGMLPE